MREQAQHTPDNGQPTDEYLRPYLPNTVRVMRTGTPWLDAVVFSLLYAGFFITFFHLDPFPAILFMPALWVWQILRKQKPFSFARFDKKITVSRTKSTVYIVLLAALFIATLAVALMELTHLYMPFIITTAIIMLLTSRFLMGWIYEEPATDHPETATELAKTAYHNAVHTHQETNPSTP